MHHQVRVTATATLERFIEVEAPANTTPEDLGRLAAGVLAGEDGQGSGEDLGNEEGSWAVLMVDPESLRIETERIRVAFPGDSRMGRAASIVPE